jgi:hypothetical protein
MSVTLETFNAIADAWQLFGDIASFAFLGTVLYLSFTGD